MSSKNLLLLGKEKSPRWQPSIQEIIAALLAEIAKGEQIYSREELATLEQKLADCEQQLANLLLQ